jgi:hypothetical protein
MTCRELLEKISPVELVMIDWKQDDNYSLLIKGDRLHINLQSMGAYKVRSIGQMVDDEIGLPCLYIVVE